jgi:hypothetical protein
VQLRAFVDELFQDLPQQHRARRRVGDAALRDVLLDLAQALTHLVVGDGLGIDEGDDVVGRAVARGGRGGRGQRQAAGCAQRLRRQRGGPEQGQAQGNSGQEGTVSHNVGTGSAG